MEDNRIQNQIAIYMTNKKLCEFTDKLKPAPVEYYAHMHAQGEEQSDGFRAYSCIGVVLQDYSNGTGDKTVRVTANLSPGYKKQRSVYVNINDLDFFNLVYRTARFIESWELTFGPKLIRDARKLLDDQRAAAQQ